MGVAIGRCCALLSVHACPNSFKGAKFYAKDTLKHAEAFAEQLSSPQIMYQAQLRTGEKIIVDDCFWTLEDAPGGGPACYAVSGDGKWLLSGGHSSSTLRCLSLLLGKSFSLSLGLGSK